MLRRATRHVENRAATAFRMAATSLWRAYEVSEEFSKVPTTEWRSGVRTHFQYLAEQATGDTPTVVNATCTRSLTSHTEKSGG